MKSKRPLPFTSSIAASLVLLSPSVLADAITWDAGGGDNNWSTLLNWSDDASPDGDDVTFNATGATASGTTSTVAASGTIASLSYSFEDAGNQHTTDLAAGQTLEVTGNFLLAAPLTDTDLPTSVTIAGAGGTLSVGGTEFQVGQKLPTGTKVAANNLDMSGLGNFTANLGAAGIFRLGATNGTSAGPQAIVKLAATSTINANLLGVGDRTGRGGLTTPQTLKLGSAVTTINANTISIGSTNGRGSGNLSFDTVDGTLVLRGLDGTSAATLNMISNGTNHNGTHVSTVDFSGHSVDVKIGTLTMARRTGTGGAGSIATLSFDTGILEVGSVNMAVATNAGMTGANNATINVGGGTATFGAITMATNSGGGATAGTLNFTGGTTTVNGNIVKGTGNTANLTLNGASAVLDMTGKNLTGLTGITYTDGLLKNLGIVNTDMTLAGSGSRVFDQGIGISGAIQGAVTGAGLGLIKQGPGALTLTGTNTYDGTTQINEGILVFGAKAAKTPATATAAAAGSVGLGVHDTDPLYFPAADVGALFTNSLAGFDLDPASGVVIDTTNAGGSFDQNVALTAARALTKTGTGTLVLSTGNSHSGTTTVNLGTLAVTDENALGTTAGDTSVIGASGTTGTSLSLSLATSGLTITENINLSANAAGRATLINNSAQGHVLNGNLDITSATNAVQITSSNNAGSITINGDISGTFTSGSGILIRGNSTNANNRILGDLLITGADLTKTDDGTWLVGAPGKSYSWVDTRVAVGTLILGKADIVSGTGRLLMGNSTGTTTPTLDLNGFSQSFSQLIYNGAASQGVRTITNNSATAAVLTIQNAVDNSPVGLSGLAANSIVLAGNLGLTKQGVGKLTLSGTNSYTGNTTVEEGTLSLLTPDLADGSTVSIGTLANPGTAFLDLPNAGNDNVAVLFIDGVEQLPGMTYGNASSILPVIATAAITGPGTITVAGAGTPYSNWADTFLPGNDVSDPDGDNDNDGLSNQQEFAFGLSPIDGSSVNPILVPLDKTAGTFTYQRRAETGLTYRVLTSTDLIAWPEDEAATLGQSATLAGDIETVVVTLTGAPLTETRLFFRVVAD